MRTPPGAPPQEDPYRRKIPTFSAELDRKLQAEVVELGPVEYDRSEFKTRYEPGHPAADERGYVRTPNVETLVEMVDMREAQRSYEANLNLISATRRMLQKTIEILRA